MGITTYTYTTPGVYNAVLQVEDNEYTAGGDTYLPGNTAQDSIQITVYPATLLTANAFANPTEGMAPLTVRFTGTGTKINGTIKKFRNGILMVTAHMTMNQQQQV